MGECSTWWIFTVLNTLLALNSIVLSEGKNPLMLIGPKDY